MFCFIIQTFTSKSYFSKINQYFILSSSRRLIKSNIHLTHISRTKKTSNSFFLKPVYLRDKNNFLHLKLQSISISPSIQKSLINDADYTIPKRLYSNYLFSWSGSCKNSHNNVSQLFNTFSHINYTWFPLHTMKNTYMISRWSYKQDQDDASSCVKVTTGADLGPLICLDNVPPLKGLFISPVMKLLLPVISIWNTNECGSVKWIWKLQRNTYILIVSVLL